MTTIEQRQGDAGISSRLSTVMKLWVL